MKLAPFICTTLLFLSPLSSALSNTNPQSDKFKINMNIFFEDKISSKSTFIMQDKEDTTIHVTDDKKIHDLNIYFLIQNNASHNYIDINTIYKYRCGDDFYTTKSYELYSPQNEAKVTLRCPTGESYTITTSIERT